MAKSILYCHDCNERFNVAPDTPDCPLCGQTLVAWMDVPTLDFSRGAAASLAEDDATDDELIGAELGTYLIEAFLGQGGMARVYRARHLTLERPCAIKVLRPSVAARDPDAVTSLLAEARAAAALVHPHVVTLHTIGYDRQYHFVEMEFVDGASLVHLLRSEGPLGTTDATRFMVHVSSALAAAHKLGMIHRDIKPSNVMVTRHGVAKLADFGLAKRLVARVEGRDTRVLAGTPQYMAPELFQGEPANKRSDVYAMGVMYFCLLTGRLPIPGESASELLKVHSQKTTMDLEAVIVVAGSAAGLMVQRCLAHDPQRRYADAVQLHEEFRALYGALRSLGSLLGESLAGSEATITGSGDRFVVSIELAGGRSQKVYVEACQGAAVTEQVVKIYSICGPVCQRYLRRALELNAEIPHGSIAIQTVEGQPHFVMSNTYPRATCDPEEVRKSTLTIAKHADEVEHRLTGGDTH